MIRKIVGNNNILIENVIGSPYQVIPVLGVQRLMGPKVVGFLSEKFLTLLCHKRLIIKSISGGIFKNCTQKPPGKNIEGAPRTHKAEKKNHVQFRCKCRYKMAAWLEQVIESSSKSE